MNLKSSKQLVDEALKQIKTIYPKELNNIINKNKKTLLIDIRDVRELKKTGKIKNAKHIPRGMLEFWLDPLSPYFKNEFTVDRFKILYCASNWRSALATKTLQDMGFTNVCHVGGGFPAIVDEGFEVETVN
ncbi:MAG: rhodanese [Candidatus Pelagibacter sp.]|nr:rhodanese [Candidatus Pelagibacter sp.]|tara:strand:- start:1917 stop:2309 length:393 start_codon:yes stop_codon:yes gene_type:complete